MFQCMYSHPLCIDALAMNHIKSLCDGSLGVESDWASTILTSAIRTRKLSTYSGGQLGKGHLFSIPSLKIFLVSFSFEDSTPASRERISTHREEL
jgi:hypothetical protein